MAKQVISIDDLCDGDISRLFFAARSLAQIKKRNNEENAILLTAFFEPSTRTRLSFSVAAMNLGFKVLDFDPKSSSLSKGETMMDTLQTIACLSPSVLITRTNISLSKEMLSSLPLALINGGDGCNEHPSQALLDAFTLLNAWRTDDLFNKNIIIIGDIATSRVAHSNIKLLRRLGARISVLVPPYFASPNIPYDDVEYFDDFAKIPGNVDAVMVLRIPKERMEQALKVSDAEYFNRYGLNIERFLALGPDCVLLHPGPQNIGIEIDGETAQHPRSLIRQQVKNGVSLRAALIDHCTTV